uniref:Uncharacterized protein n=1 Tax=Rhodnius prolixus TaxID=13249 RepID=T1HMG0_RHOPR
MEQLEDSDSFEDDSASQVESEGRIQDTDGAICSLWMMDNSSKDINNKIEVKNEEISILKEIIVKQTENMQELQKKCEEAIVILKQLPEIQQAASERYEEALKISAGLQLKQCEINEILENAFKLYDNTLQLIESARENFKTERDAGKQRQLVFEADITEMKKLGASHDSNLNSSNVDVLESGGVLGNKGFLKSFVSCIIILTNTTAYTNSQVGDRISTDLNKKIKDKDSLLKTVELRLAGYNCRRINEELACLNAKIKALELAEEQENEQVFLIESQLQRSKEESEFINDSFLQNKSALMKEIENYKQLLRNEELSYSNYQLKIKESGKVISKLTECNDRMDKEVLEEKNVTKTLEEEISEKQLEIEKSTLTLSEMKMNLPELSILTTMLREKQMLVNQMEEEIKQCENTLRSNEDMLINLEIRNNNLNEKLVIEERVLNNQAQSNRELQASINQLKTEVGTANARLMNNEKTLEQRNEEVLNRTNQIVREDNKVVQEIAILQQLVENKKVNLEERRKEISLKKSDLEEKSHKVRQLEAEIRQVNLYLLTEGQIYWTMCKQTEEEVNKLESLCNSIKCTVEGIGNEKIRFEKIKEAYIEKCEAVNVMYNTKIDFKLKELEELKKNLSLEKEMYSEECGKVHFQYYTLKNEKRFVTGEMNYLLSVVNRCNGEYIIMDSYKDWLSKKSMSFLCELSEAGEKLVEQKWLTESALQVHNVPPAREDAKSCSSGSDSSLDLPAEEFITMKISTSKTTGDPSYQDWGYCTGCNEVVLLFLDAVHFGPKRCDHSGRKYFRVRSTSGTSQSTAIFMSLILLQSSDSEPVAEVSNKRKLTFLEKPKGPPLKMAAPVLKKDRRADRLIGRKTILDLVIDSS